MSARTPLSQPISAGKRAGVRDSSLQHLLEKLFREQLAIEPDNG